MKRKEPPAPGFLTTIEDLQKLHGKYADLYKQLKLDEKICSTTKAYNDAMEIYILKAFNRDVELLSEERRIEYMKKQADTIARNNAFIPVYRRPWWRFFRRTPNRAMRIILNSVSIEADRAHSLSEHANDVAEIELERLKEQMQNDETEQDQTSAPQENANDVATSPTPGEPEAPRLPPAQPRRRRATPEAPAAPSPATTSEAPAAPSQLATPEELAAPSQLATPEEPAAPSPATTSEEPAAHSPATPEEPAAPSQPTTSEAPAAPSPATPEAPRLSPAKPRQRKSPKSEPLPGQISIDDNKGD